MGQRRHVPGRPLGPPDGHCPHLGHAERGVHDCPRQGPVFHSAPIDTFTMAETSSNSDVEMLEAVGPSLRRRRRQRLPFTLLRTSRTDLRYLPLTRTSLRGRRDAKPRPSPWKGEGFVRLGPADPLKCGSVHPVFRPSTQFAPVVELYYRQVEINSASLARGRRRRSTSLLGVISPWHPTGSPSAFQMLGERPEEECFSRGRRPA